MKKSKSILMRNAGQTSACESFKMCKRGSVLQNLKGDLLNN